MPSIFVFCIFCVLSVQVSGGTVRELLAGLKSIGNSRAVNIVQKHVLFEENDNAHDEHLTTGRIF